jgi:hypothetical protein
MIRSGSCTYGWAIAWSLNDMMGRLCVVAYLAVCFMIGLMRSVNYIYLTESWKSPLSQV